MAEGGADPMLAYILGLAHYRTGEWDEAIRRLEESGRASPGSDWVKWPALALAHYRRGDLKEANMWLGKAEKRLQQDAAVERETGLFGGAESFDFRILTNEARSTLQGGKL